MISRRRMAVAEGVGPGRAAPMVPKACAALTPRRCRILWGSLMHLMREDAANIEGDGFLGRVRP